MSQQKSLNAFFSVRKQAVDQHAAKRRKVALDAPTSTNASVSKAKVAANDEVVRILEKAKAVVRTHTTLDKDESSSSSTSSGKDSVKVIINVGFQTYNEMFFRIEQVGGKYFK
jgi:flagellar hook assembly protein FlgD